MMFDQTNFKENIEHVAGDEKIEAISIGAFGWGTIEGGDSEAHGFERSDRKPIPAKLKRKPVEWDTVKDYLDYTYDYGFGAPECHAVTVWTKASIIVVGTYDGSTYLMKLPRNPIEHEPTMIGGG